MMPIMHLGRPGFFYWLFPYSTVMGVWPQVRSPLWWDFICLLCYILMSIMFYYVGLLPDLATVRDLAQTRPKQIFYGVLALGWRGSARHWRNQRTVYFIMCGDHGADGHFGAQRRRPRFRRRPDPGLAFDAVPALFLLWRGDFRAGIGDHADDPRPPRLRAPGHHHRISFQRAGQGHAGRQPDARLLLSVGGVGCGLRQQRRRQERVLFSHLRLLRPLISGQRSRSIS